MDKLYITYIINGIYQEDVSDRIVFSDELRELICVLLRRLTKKQLLIIDKCAQGMNMSEVARFFEISRSTVRWHRDRAIRRIRNPTWFKSIRQFVKKG